MSVRIGRHRLHPNTPTVGRAGPLIVGLAVSFIALTLSGLAWADPLARPEPGAAGESPMPCAKTVKACARLSTDEAWLGDGRGSVVIGPVRMNHGADGMETPAGSFTVQWKNRDHYSREAGGTPMPYSVFFDGNGRAFHGGDPARQSAGCVRLERDVAKKFFDSLQPGDQVQILP